MYRSNAGSDLFGKTQRLTELNVNLLITRHETMSLFTETVCLSLHVTYTYLSLHGVRYTPYHTRGNN